MSIYQSTCERFICSPVASALTAILSAAYFITYPSFSSLFLSAAVVRCVDLLQKRLLKYDLERFKSFPRTVVDEEEEETHEQVEQPDVPEDETQEQVEQPDVPEDEANDEHEEDEEYIPSHKPNLKRRTYNLRNRSD